MGLEEEENSVTSYLNIKNPRNVSTGGAFYLNFITRPGVERMSGFSLARMIEENSFPLGAASENSKGNLILRDVQKEANIGL